MVIQAVTLKLTNAQRGGEYVEEDGGLRVDVITLRYHGSMNPILYGMHF